MAAAAELKATQWKLYSFYSAKLIKYDDLSADQMHFKLGEMTTRPSPVNKTATEFLFFSLQCRMNERSERYSAMITEYTR